MQVPVPLSTLSAWPLWAISPLPACHDRHPRMKKPWEVPCTCRMSSRHDVRGLAGGPCSFDCSPGSPHSQHEALASPGLDPLASKQASEQAASAGELLGANSRGQCRVFHLDNSSHLSRSVFTVLGQFAIHLARTLSLARLSPDRFAVLHNQTHRHTPSLVLPHA